MCYDFSHNRNLQMPHPQDWKGGQMPRSSGGEEGEGGGGTAGIDWCMYLSKFDKYLTASMTFIY